LRAELRGQTYFRVCGQVLEVLEAAAVQPGVLRGAALATSVYPRPALRHCHDLDLLVPLPEQERAVAALRAAGLRAGGERPGPGSRCVTHPSGLPVLLHSRLFGLDYANGVQAAMLARSEPTEGLGAASMLGPADALLQVLGHAVLAPHRPGPFWPVDAWLIIRRRSDLDWSTLVETARAGRLTLPLFTLLRYLARELDAAVPAAVLDQLARHCPDRLEREGALRGAQAAAGGRYLDLLRRAAGWRARAAVLQWLLLPSPAYLAVVGSGRAPERLPLYYFGRLARQAGRELAWHRQELGKRFRVGRGGPAAAAAPPRPE
jgi:hypothetical protein